MGATMGNEARQMNRRALVLALSCLNVGLRVASAARLFNTPPDQLDAVLQDLSSEGITVCQGECWRLAADSPALPELLDEAFRSVSRESGAARDVLCGLAQCARGNVFEGVNILLEQVRRLAFHSATPATLCLEMTLGPMERMPLEGAPGETRRQYVLTAIEIADVAANFFAMTKEVCPILDKAIQSATWHGDRRSVAILNIIKAHMLTFATFRLSQEADRLFQTGFEMGKSFGDADMLEYITTFLGFRHFVQGQFPETVRYLERVRRGFALPSSVYWWELFYGMSSAFVGLDRQGVGILESCWRSARLRGDRLAEATWRLHLAALLLMAGKRKEALGHLDVLNESIGNDALPFLRWRLCWFLVHYHFLSGNLAAAHAMRERSARIFQDLGMTMPLHHFPWMLRVLYALNKAGFPEVPAFSFSNALDMSLKSPSLQLQASVWAVKGAMFLDGEGSVAEARTACKRALKLFLGVGNQVEAARVKLDLARANMLAGRRTSADRLREGAYAVHLAYGQPEWPEGLPRPRAVRSRFSAMRAPFGRRERGQEDASLAESLTDVYQQLLSKLCRELRAEQGALLVVKNGEIDPLARYNLSKALFESVEFSRRRNWLRKEASSTQISRRDGPEGHAVCIPLKRGETRCLVYLSNAYFTKEMDALGNVELRAAAETICEHLQLAQHWSAKAEGGVSEGMVIMPQEDPGMFLTRNSSMLRLLQKIEQIAATDAPALIFGETGVGKELLAKHIHTLSARKGPFVCVHPASMTESLFESAFFGHEKGAFTGATSQKIGFFELANHGTLFIDEVGEMPLSLQTKFLRVLQEHTFIRVGGLREIRSDFRLVTATNRDLEKEVAAGTFRQDLYYRLSVVPVHIPPLRLRNGDAAILAQHFFSLYSRKYHRQNISLSRTDLLKISSYSWPGNVRELENVIERAVILADEGPLELSLSFPGEGGKAPDQAAAPAAQIIADWPTLAELERRYIKMVLEQTGGQIYGTNGAEGILGIGRSTLYNKIRQFGFKARRHYE